MSWRAEFEFHGRRRACSDDLAVGIPATDFAAGARLVREDGGIDGTKKPVVWCELVWCGVSVV